MRIVLFANTDWYLYNFRLSLAKALVDDEWSRETTRDIVDEVRELAIPASWEKLRGVRGRSR